jgi:hypothetical protein
MDKHLLICQIKTVSDLTLLVSETTEMGERNTIVLHLKKDCFSAMEDTEFEQVKRILLDPYIISILIIDCEFSMSLYEKMYVFDLCFISEGGALRYDLKHENGLRFLHLLFSPKTSLGKEAGILNYEELMSYGFANALLRKESLREDLELEIQSLTMDRTREQLYGIKSCMNAYKDCCLFGKTLITDPEPSCFCQLALLKTEEDKK